jgi:chemotaxis protein MotB
VSGDQKGDHKHAKHPKHEEHEEHEEHVNHEAWVIPYADLLTLLLAMFLALWASSNADTAKMTALANAFRAENGLSIIEGSPNVVAPPMGNSPSNVVTPAISPNILAQMQAQALKEKRAAEAAKAAEGKTLDNVEKQIKEAAKEAGLADKLSFRREERGLVVTIVSDQVLFPAGDSGLLPDGFLILDGLASSLKATGKPIAIEGHTDSRPVSNGRFPSNWELSTSRATQVLRYLVNKHGFSPTKLTASGYADTKPLSTGTAEDDYARNRRVEVVVLSTVK